MTAQTPHADSSLVLSSRGMTARQAFERVDHELRSRQVQLAAIAGEAKVAERLVTLSLSALANPRLANTLRTADLATVFLAVREAAAMDLVPNGIAGDGWLVPYWNAEKGLYDIQFQAGWKGLQKLLAGTAEVASGVVYEADTFEYEQGSREFVRHVMALRDRGERIAAWADATLLASGNHRVEIMTIADIEQRRRASRMADRGAWVEWYDPMTRKTVTRALVNRIPRLPERLERLIAYEDAAEDRSTPPEHPPVLTSSTPSAADRARQLLGVEVPGALEANQQPATGSAVEGPAAPPTDDGDGGPEPGCPVVHEQMGPCTRSLVDHEGKNHRNSEGETWA